MGTSVKRHAGVGGLHQVLQQVVRVLLLVHKDDDRALLLVVAQDLQQLQELLVLFDHQLQERGRGKETLI